MKHLALPLLALTSLCSAAPPTVYRCETSGRIGYSDTPCVGARVIDVTATQGADKMTGRSIKGKEVQGEEFHRTLDDATRSLHGLSHGEMDVLRRRQKLSSATQMQCALLDRQVPAIAARIKAPSGAFDGRSEVELYKARKRVFDLGC